MKLAHSAVHTSMVLIDLKPANLLFARDGQMKLADFGLARSHSSPEKMTSEVVTRYNTPPSCVTCVQLRAVILHISPIFAEITSVSNA